MTTTQEDQDINTTRQISIREDHAAKENKYKSEEIALEMEFTCPICYNTQPSDLKRHPLKCEHEFCLECYFFYLEEKILKNDVNIVLTTKYF